VSHQDWPTDAKGPNMDDLATYWRDRLKGASIPSTDDILCDDLDVFQSTLLLLDFPGPKDIGAYFAYGGMFDWHDHKNSNEDYLGLFEDKHRAPVLELIGAIRSVPCGFCGTVEHHSIVQKVIYQRSFLALPTLDALGNVEYFINVDDEGRYRRHKWTNSVADRGFLTPNCTRFVEVELIDLGMGVPPELPPLVFS